ncbi:type I-E CRISPR-associated protein Cas5/CasD [Embleya sp. NPDC001921]
MQSWGDRSAFNRRETRPEPTKSGIVGLLAAAAGRPREADITDLAGLRVGVRVDRAGSLLRDYHIVSDYRGQPLPQAGVTAKGVQKLTSPVKHTHVTQRFYLQDAAFLAGVEGPTELITTLDRVVSKPAFPLALGRRSCVPTHPITLGVRDTTLEEALRSEKWQVGEYTRKRHTQGGRPLPTHLSATFEDPAGDDVAHDQPLSFHPLRRAYTSRRIRQEWIPMPTDPDTAEPAADENTGHDPFALLDR